MIIFIEVEKYLKLTASLPLKIGRTPIGKACIPTIHFQGRAVSFREGIFFEGGMML